MHTIEAEDGINLLDTAINHDWYIKMCSSNQHHYSFAMIREYV
jgi:hypothetical protein